MGLRSAINGGAKAVRDSLQVPSKAPRQEQDRGGQIEDIYVHLSVTMNVCCEISAVRCHDARVMGPVDGAAEGGLERLTPLPKEPGAAVSFGSVICSSCAMTLARDGSDC